MNPVKVTYQYHNFICAKHFGVYADGYKQPMGFIAIEEIADEDLTGIKAKILSEKEIGMKMREFIIKEEMAEDSKNEQLTMKNLIYRRRIWKRRKKVKARATMLQKWNSN